MGNFRPSESGSSIQDKLNSLKKVNEKEINNSNSNNNNNNVEQKNDKVLSTLKNLNETKSQKESEKVGNNEVPRGSLINVSKKIESMKNLYVVEKEEKKENNSGINKERVKENFNKMKDLLDKKNGY